ncbi:MAG: ParB/RepB/Spo0J family partition protein [Clostridia bacterium]|nr:ParB/RepB/Spo0J family partition protein [Clostridia bacterium]
MVKKGLGKGLGALIPGNAQSVATEKKQEEFPGEKILLIPTSKIISNPDQPRKDFSQEKIEELAQSIKENGLIQPIIVRKNKDKFQIVAGERRFRACSLLGHKEIEGIIRDFDDEKTSRVALIENIQRQDLNPIEEARAYKSLIEQHGLTQGELGEILGKSRSSITNAIRLLELPQSVINMVTEGKISMGHGRALLPLENQKIILECAKEIADKGLNVRQTEALVKKRLEAKKIEEIFKVESVELARIKENLQTIFSTKVEIRGTEKKGKIELEYYNLDDLNRILEIIDKK